MERRTRKTPLSFFTALWIIALCLLSGCGASAVADAANETADAPDASGVESAADSARANNRTKIVRLGASLYALEVSRNFVPVSIPDEYCDDDMVAYYRNDASLLDFSVYCFSKEGYPDTVKELVEAEAAYYDATEIVTDASVNGVPVGYYFAPAVEAYDAAQHDGVTYVFEDGDKYIEVDFWFIGYHTKEEAHKIMNTLTTLNTKPLSLGSCSVMIPEDFTPVERDSNAVFYYSDNASLTLRVLVSPDGGQTLEEFVRTEAAARNGSDIAPDVEVNGVPAASYRSIEPSDGAYHSVLTYVFPDEGQFVSLSFRLDGVSAEWEAAEILRTLSA